MTDRLRTDNWYPVLGDDEPYFTMYYRDVPDGYRIGDLPVPDATAYPMLNANWSRLVAIADKFYRNCEINGETLADFYENLELSLMMGKDRMEKLLENMDLIVFERGSITTRIISEDSSTSESGTKTGSNADNETKNLAKARTGSNADNETVNITDTSIELAFDSTNEDASGKVVKSGTDNVAHTINESETETGTDNIQHSINESDSKDIQTQRGTDETTSVNRYFGENGIDFFDKLINVYPNIPKLFIGMFEDDFILKEVIIW